VASIDRTSHLDEQLSAYLDGELAQQERQEVEEHLSSCPRCREELGKLRDVAEMTSESLRSVRCISTGDRAAYVNGLLDEAERRRVEKHLERCKSCRGEMDELRRWVEERLEPEQAQPARKRRRYANYISVMVPLAAAACIVVATAAGLFSSRVPAMTSLTVISAETRSSELPEDYRISFGKQHPLHTNDSIQVSFTMASQRHAVVFWVDPTGAVNTWRATLTESRHLRAGSGGQAAEVVLPSVSDSWILRADAGTDALLFVFTQQPLDGAVVEQARLAVAKLAPLPELPYGTILWLDQNGRWRCEEKNSAPTSPLDAMVEALRKSLGQADSACRGVAFAHE